MQALTSKRSHRKLLRNRLWSALFYLTILLAIGTAFLWRQVDYFHPRVGTKAEMSNSFEWIDMPGVKLAEDGLQVSPLGRAIVGLDGGTYQANPSYNTRSSFETNGDYRFRAQFVEQATFGIRLYDGLPGIYDEWRQEPAGFAVKLADGQVTVQLFDGNASSPVMVSSYKVDELANNLQIDHLGGKLVVYYNDVLLEALDDHGLSKTSRLWLGLDAERPWTLQNLEAWGLNSGRVQLSVVNLDDLELSDGLKTASKIAMKIGVAVSLEPLVSDRGYRSAVASNFNLLIPENAMKPQFIHPQKNDYSFGPADQLVDFALANGMTVHGHTLVFSEANPQWMTETALTDRGSVMINHIDTVIRHFKGKVQAWDVINEPLAEEGGLRNNIWYQALGEDYIAQALRAARSADASAQLFINEYGLEADGDRWQEFLGLVDRLLAKGVPLDGIGFQSHIYSSEDEVDARVLASHFKELQSRGLAVRISEIDVHGEDANRQAQQYQTVLKSCLNAENCQSFSTWGISDKYGSTTEVGEYPPALGDDLLWDENMTPKPAYSALLQYLRQTK